MPELFLKATILDSNTVVIDDCGKSVRVKLPRSILEFRWRAACSRLLGLLNSRTQQRGLKVDDPWLYKAVAWRGVLVRQSRTPARKGKTRAANRASNWNERIKQMTGSLHNDWGRFDKWDRWANNLRSNLSRRGDGE